MLSLERTTRMKLALQSASRVGMESECRVRDIYLGQMHYDAPLIGDDDYTSKHVRQRSSKRSNFEYTSELRKFTLACVFDALAVTTVTR